MPDSPAPDSTQTPTAEATGQSAPSSPSTAPVQPSTERKELASFGDALRQTASTDQADATEKGDKPKTPAASGTPGHSAATALTPGEPKRSGSAPADQPTAADPGHSADEVLTPETAQQGSEEPGGRGEGDEGSRRGRATIRSLTAERDTLAQQVQQLVVPESVTQQLRDVILDDGTFSALEERLKREDISGEYLTAEERQTYSQALQVRQWLRPAFALAQANAAAWANEQQQTVTKQAAAELAPVLRESDYLKPEPIGAAESWGAIYRYIRDASFEAGQAALQPKLAEKDARIDDLESELSGLRARDRSGRPLERGGVSGGAVTATPDFSTASSSDLFAAALARQERSRAGRRAAAARAS